MIYGCYRCCDMQTVIINMRCFIISIIWHVWWGAVTCHPSSSELQCKHANLDDLLPLILSVSSHSQMNETSHERSLRISSWENEFNILFYCFCCNKLHLVTRNIEPSILIETILFAKYNNIWTARLSWQLSHDISRLYIVAGCPFTSCLWSLHRCSVCVFAGL